MNMKKFLAASVVVMAMVAIPAVAQATSLPSYEGASPYSGLQVRPGTIWLSGDGSSELGGYYGLHSNIRWTSWNPWNAYGNGMQWLNDCIPYCFDGHFHGYQVSLHAYHPAWIDSVQVFTRLAVQYNHTKPPYSAYKWAFTASINASYNSYDGEDEFTYNPNY
jgi:hypothetical protein